MLRYKLGAGRASSPEQFNEWRAVCPEGKASVHKIYSTEMPLPYGKQTARTLHIIILIVHDIV